MTFPDASLVVRMPIVVPAGTLLLIFKLFIVIAMDFSLLNTVWFVLCDKLPASVSDHLSSDRPITFECLTGLIPSCPMPDAGLLQAAASDDPPGRRKLGNRRIAEEPVD